MLITAASTSPAAEIDRPRIDRRLEASLKFAVTVLLGPAGCGKSVVLRNCPELQSAIRFRAGSAGHTFASFVRGFARAVSQISPGAEKSFARAWERGMQSGAPEQTLARWICEHLAASERPIVFDDLHDATKDAAIAGFIEKVAELRAPRCVVIAARVPGLLPIALWMATGAMQRQIDDVDLRFTAAETRALAQAADVDISSDQGQLIVQQTAGLAVAVHYAVLRYAASRGPHFELFDSHDAIADAIFLRRSEPEREMLLASSVFPVVRADVLATLGYPDPGALQRGAGADAVFIWEQGSLPESRLHDRFRDYLARRLGTYDDAYRVSLTLRMVRALETAGHCADAVAVATTHRLPQALARLIDGHGFAILESGQIDVIGEAISLIDGPKGAVATALRGYLESVLGRLDTSEAWFALGLDTAEDAVSRATIALYYGRELINRRRPDAHLILEPYADEVDLPLTLQLDVRSSYAQALLMAGHAGEACRRTDSVVAMLDSASSAGLHARVLGRAAYVAIESGAIETARSRAQAAVSLAMSESLYDVAMSAHSVLYSIAYDFDDDAAASMRHLRLLGEAGGKAGTLRSDLYEAVAMYELHAEAGDQEDLSRIDRAVSRFDVHYHTPEITEGLLPAKARQAGWSGDFTRAHEILRPTVDHQASGGRKALRWAEIGLYAGAAGDAAPAVRAAETALVLLASEAERSVRGELTIALVSLALWVVGDIERAAHSFANSTAIAQRAPRIRALRAAIACLITHSANRRRLAQLLPPALAELRAVAFGGFALLIEALPYNVQLPTGERITATLGAVITAFNEAVPALPRSAQSRYRNQTSGGAINAGVAGRAAIDITLPVDEIDAQIDRFVSDLDRVAPLMAEHSRAVSAWCARIARKLGLDTNEIVYLTRCGLIHDIGKIMTPAAILHAPRRLSLAEWSVMKMHASDGARIIANIPELGQFMPIVRGHHERIDGRGYPDGLRMSAIPLAARIVTVADCFNAMIGRRPYSLPLAPTDALEELHRNKHSQLDPEIVDAMTQIVMGSTHVGTTSEPIR